MASVKDLPRFDAAEHLKTDEEMAWFMEDAMATGDAGFIAHALGIVARAKGMAKIASETGLSREQLYKSLGSHGNPTLKTMLSVMSSLGLKMTITQPAKPKRSTARKSRKVRHAA